MDQSEFQRRLDKIYASIPVIACKGNCGQRPKTCCGPIGCTKAEADLIEQHTGQSVYWLEDTIPGAVVMDMDRHNICPFLTLNGRCAAYEVRPAICRLWGVVKRMACPHGCVPVKWIDDKDAYRILKAIDKLNSEK